MSRLVAAARRLSKCGPLMVGLLSVLVGVPHAGAQVVGGTILGTISDPSGGIVSHAQILIGNLENGTTRAVETDAAGFYAVPNLQPGAYLRVWSGRWGSNQVLLLQNHYRKIKSPSQKGGGPVGASVWE